MAHRPFSASESEPRLSVSSVSFDLEKDNHSDTPLLSDCNCKAKPGNHRYASWTKARVLIPLIVALLITNVATLCFLLTSRKLKPEQRCVSDPPGGTPRIYANVPKTTAPKLFNATFYDKDANPYRLPASPEGDAAWNGLINQGVMLVQKGEEATAQIDTKKHIYWDHPEMGMVGYPVLAEAVHQVHCLDMVRKHLYFNIDYTREHYDAMQIMAGEKIRRLHIDHCVDLLRMRLMCTADMGLMPVTWVGYKGHMVADFVANHTCRDFEALMDTVGENIIDLPDGSVLPVEGDYVLMDYE